MLAVGALRGLVLVECKPGERQRRGVPLTELSVEVQRMDTEIHDIGRGRREEMGYQARYS